MVLEEVCLQEDMKVNTLLRYFSMEQSCAPTNHNFCLQTHAGGQAGLNNETILHLCTKYAQWTILARFWPNDRKGPWGLGGTSHAETMDKCYNIDSGSGRDTFISLSRRFKAEG